jgi:hypothetical protein
MQNKFSNIYISGVSNREISVRNLSYHTSVEQKKRDMWILEVADGDGPWLFSTNNFVGRQIWKFKPHVGTPEEHARVEIAREQFRSNRSRCKASSDVLKNFQVSRE